MELLDYTSDTLTLEIVEGSHLNVITGELSLYSNFLF